MPIVRTVAWTLLGLLIGPGPAPCAEARPALTIRLVRPEAQCLGLLALFDGSRAPHPAAALAAWKRATGGRRGLGKTIEAGIVLINPETARELRTLHNSEVAFAFDPDDGRLRWYATLPRDDGTFAALETALSLTGGAVEPPLEGAAVDRLGPPGSALMARMGDALVAAGSRADLRAGLDHARAGPAPRPGSGSGCLFHLDPDALAAPGSLVRRRLAEGLRAVGCRELDGLAGLEGETIRIVVTGRWIGPAPGGEAIDPAWLDWVPASRPLAAFAAAIDPKAEAWDAAFAMADRMERADPARAGVAPLRARLNLLALAAGVRPEADLWPLLRGLTACATAGPTGEVDGSLLALHAIDPAAADRVAHALLASLRLSGPADPPRAGDAGIRRLGQASGRPLALARRGATVLIGWGDGLLPACLEARDHPGRSAGPAIRAAWGPSSPSRVGALWPGRWPGLVPAGSPAAEALAEAPPILWWGVREGATTRDEIRWTGLRGLVRRFLDRLPMDPPPGD